MFNKSIKSLLVSGSAIALLVVPASAQAAASPKVVTKSFMRSIVNKDSRQWCLLTDNAGESSRAKCIKQAKEWFFHSGSDYASDRRSAVRALNNYSHWSSSIRGSYARVSFPRDNSPVYLHKTSAGVWRVLSPGVNPPIFTG